MGMDFAFNCYFVHHYGLRELLICYMLGHVCACAHRQLGSMKVCGPSPYPRLLSVASTCWSPLRSRALCQSPACCAELAWWSSSPPLHSSWSRVITSPESQAGRRQAYHHLLGLPPTPSRSGEAASVVSQRLGRGGRLSVKGSSPGARSGQSQYAPCWSPLSQSALWKEWPLPLSPCQ